MNPNKIPEPYIEPEWVYDPGLMYETDDEDEGFYRPDPEDAGRDE